MATATAMANTAGVYTAAKRSTKRWVGARAPWACSTARMMRSSVVWPAAAVTRNSSSDWALSVPAYTGSPGALSTARLSPVTLDSSTALRPVVTTPSSGTRPPGRMRTVLSTATSAAGTVRHWPSGPRTSAWSGLSASRAPMASRARPTARSSMRSARAYSAITMAASGHWPIRNAPVTATAISALMPNWPRISERRPLR